MLYYIAAPDYRQSSAGITSLYKLCEILNRLGDEAYIAYGEPPAEQPLTPPLTPALQRRHQAEGRLPIAVYPEIISGNPLDTLIVARWTLNKPGHLGGNEAYGADDLVFAFDPAYAPENHAYQLLNIATIDTDIFYPPPADQAREGACYFANKFIAKGYDVPERYRQHTSLCLDIPRSRQEIAEILRRSECLYCFEESRIIQEAILCGCPVVMVPSDYLMQLDTRHFTGDGIAVESEANHMSRIQATVGRAALALLAAYRATIWDIQSFRQITRERWDSVNNQLRATHFAASENDERIALRSLRADSPKAGNRNYQAWHNERQILDSDANLLGNHMAEQWPSFPSVQVLIRVTADDFPALAQTLESLNFQLYDRWHADVISDEDGPPGIEAVNALSWHVMRPEEQKTQIDFLVSARRSDWIVEIPPGAMLDPLYLWRIIDQSFSVPACTAICVDDDQYDADGLRQAPRFKPGVNPALMRSSDLAGPLAIRRDTWRIAGGAGKHRKCPWLAQLLELTKQQGWQTLSHIPDVLISYPASTPDYHEACLASLAESSPDIADCQLIPVGPTSWRLLPQRSARPAVTVAIISRGQLEFAQPCLESLAQHTDFPNMEVLVVRQEIDDAGYITWLEQLDFRGKPVEQLVLPSEAPYAELCNAAVCEATHQIVLLLDEATRILSPDWLDRLVDRLEEDGVAAVSPRLVAPQSGDIVYAGGVFGLAAQHESIHAGMAGLQDDGYLGTLQLPRDISLLSANCALVRREDFVAAGGMNSSEYSGQAAMADLSLRLIALGKRNVFDPTTTLVVYAAHLRQAHGGLLDELREHSKTHCDHRNFALNWLRTGVSDPFWSSNLDLSNPVPEPEADYHPAWQYLPVTGLPRIAARPVSNAQGDYRVVSPLRAARRAGRVLDCIWPQFNEREWSPFELARLGCDTLIVQNYLLDPRLNGLQTWREAGLDAFICYALDDLFTEMPQKSSLRQGVPANARSRFREALRHCNRMVVSTDFLAEAYAGLIDDIRVVPNRLEGDLWLPLSNKRRTARKPRIGWAGGTTHLGDLQLLKSVIEATRDEADWIFFGMAPEEIRPLLHEFHRGVEFTQYPAKLASLNLDLAVAPLEINRFNQGKSNLRLLEYGALGIPVIATDIDPYRNSPACLVKNNSAAWLEAIRSRLDDSDARDAEGDAMRAWVHRHFILENHIDEWLQAHLP